MKKIILMAIILLHAGMVLANDGSKLIRMQQRQERIIRSALKRNKITDNEYRKLMNEQRVIKRYIDLAEADHYWNQAELKRVRGKLDRAESRLKRYKTNWEE